MPKFSTRSKLLAVAVTVLMAGTCVFAVAEKLLFDDTIDGHKITLEDGRQGRILYLRHGEAAIEIECDDGKMEVTNIPWTKAFQLAGMSKGKIGLIIDK